MPSSDTPAPPRYIWRHRAWPGLTFDRTALAPALDQARLEQGRLLGSLGAIGLAQANEVQRELWVQEALATAAIEGQQLNLESLRSSVAHRLALADAPGTDRSAEGLVQVMQDALTRHSAPLDVDRLCRWQSALFPGGTSGIARIAVGRLRDHADAMQIVSEPLGREVVHYEAFTRACVASQAVVRDATDKAQFRLRAAQCHINPRQSKVLERLLAAGHVGSSGGFLGGMSNEKYARITDISSATAARDLADLVAHGLLRVEGVGKATRYAVNMPGWEQPVVP